MDLFIKEDNVVMVQQNHIQTKTLTLPGMEVYIHTF